jgi:hypothetical protein
MRVKRWAAVSAVTLTMGIAAGACGGTTDNAVVRDSNGGSVSAQGVAKLVHAPGAVYAVTQNDLFEARSSKFTKVGALPASGDVALAFPGSGQAYLASLSGQSVRVFQSSNDGASWSASPGINGQTPPDGFTHLSLAATASRLFIVADEVTSSNFSSAAGFVRATTGARWTSVKLPTGGSVTALGDMLWLVGGPANDRLYASSDGVSWQSATPPGLPPQATLANPVATGDGTILPVTVMGSTGQLRYYLTRDGGATWTQVASTPVSQGTEAGVSIPESVSADTWIVISPDGSKIYKGTFSSNTSQTVISPNGLPGGVVQTEWSDSNDGVALVVNSACPQGKDSCRSMSAVFSTTDGGQTWNQE